LLIAAVVAIGASVAIAATSALDRGSTGGDDVIPGIQGARASLHRSGARAELQVSGMPQPPIGEVYEVWLNRASAPPQATDALFTVTSAGLGSVDAPGGLRGVREVMVTAEPLGGSTSPSSVAVLRVTIAHTR
jgi:hypothetical protein